MVGFLLVRSRFVVDDATATLANLVAHESLARVGIALELGAVLTQALAARGSSASSAPSAGHRRQLAAFGLVNPVVILVSAALLATAFDLAGGPSGPRPAGPSCCT